MSSTKSLSGLFSKSPKKDQLQTADQAPDAKQEHGGDTHAAGVPQPPPPFSVRDRLRPHLDRILPRLAIPMAILVGSAITAGTTYALVRRVQHLIATATVSSDPEVWMQAARTQAYDACYLGCTDCDDTNYAWNACTRTAAANVTGTICDANRMWNWRDRYPIVCLQAVGEFYKADALEALKQSYRNQLAIIILTVLGGVVGGWLTLKIWRRMTQRRRERYWESQRWPRSSVSAPAWETKKGRARGRVRNKLRLVLASFLALFDRAKAYPCTGYDDVANQYFVNANRTIFGVVHGWFSDCYDTQQCSTSCSTSCSGSGSSGGGGCSTSCSTTCWTVTFSDRSPAQYVADVLPKVRECGFTLEDQVEGDVSVRVANAKIEQTWWVKIGVNGYNITDLRDTDDQILCLHSIGDASK